MAVDRSLDSKKDPRDSVSAAAAALADSVMGFGSHRISSQTRMAIEAAVETPLLRAKRAIRSRRERGRYFSQAIFSEPAWDMLLELFVAYEERTDVPIGALGIASGAPATTALRYIAVLEDEGLIMRTRDERDARRVLISLTKSAYVAMRSYWESDNHC